MDVENKYVRKFGILLIVIIMMDLGLRTFYSGMISKNIEVALGILVVWISAIGFLIGIMTEKVDLGSLEKYVVIGLLFSFLIYGYTTISVVYPGNIGSDGVHFMKSSAELVLEGENPYGPTIQEDNSVMFYTAMFNGEMVGELLYPALSFLLYIPMVLLGIDVRFLNLSLIILSALIIYRITPKRFGVLPLVVFGASPYLLRFGSIDIDLLWVNLVIGALLFFEYRNKLSAVLYGLGAAVKPIPWVIAPFILLHFYRDGKLSDEGLDYVFYSVGSFMSVNLPFALSNPYDWFLQVFNLPLKFLGVGSAEVYFGQGFSLLSFSGIANFSPVFYSRVALFSLILFGVAYYLYFEDMKQWFWVAPVIVFFFTHRGFVEYYLFFMPVAAAVILKRYYIEEGELDELRERLSV